MAFFASVSIDGNPTMSWRAPWMEIEWSTMPKTRLIVYPDAEENLAPLFTGERLARLEKLGKFTAYYGGPPSNEEYIRRISGADAIISGWGLTNEVLEAAVNLDCMSFIGLGAASVVDINEAARLGVTVTHTLSAADTIAEHTVALMLAASRNIARLDRDMRDGVFNMELQGFDLRGKTLGLIGFGRIARAVVPLVRAFGMQVVAWTRNPKSEDAARLGIEFRNLDDLIAESDVLSLHLLLSPDTDGLIDAARLRKTKPGVVIVNTARSQVLDEVTMVELLATGHIASAGLDVFNEEPLPPGHPLIKLDNVVLTPHVAYNTPEAVAGMIDISIDNLEAFFRGAPKNVTVSSS